MVLQGFSNPELTLKALQILKKAFTSFLEVRTCKTFEESLKERNILPVKLIDDKLTMFANDNVSEVAFLLKPSLVRLAADSFAALPTNLG